MWENLTTVLEEYAVELRNLYQDNLIAEDKIATGELLNNVDYVIEKDDRCIEVSLKLEDYYKYIEYGRQPGKFPPPDKIKEWIMVKPILPTPYRGKLPTPDQLAYLIGRKIALEGIEPTPVLERSIQSVNTKFEERIMDAIDKDVNNMIDVIFSEYFVGE